MRSLRSTLLSLALVTFHLPAAFAEPPAAPNLLTVAERSGFKATALHADVVALLDALASSSPLARRATLGTSGEGRDLPMIIMADPPVATAAQAREQIDSHGKLLVLAIGNIHAGEVEGKEALPMLAREILAGDPKNPGQPHPLLKHLIIAFAPIYNADGNERVSKTNRPGQIGPEDGMGIRENAKGLDLNRDFVKVEASETAGLVKFFVEWDPHLFVDCHTTNGSYHRHIITYAGPKLPAGDAALNRYAFETWFPALKASFDASTGQSANWYGSYDGVFGQAERSHNHWQTFPAEARFGTNYVGLRNRLSILCEAYSYSPYKDRVLATRDFVRCILTLAAENRDVIIKLAKDADNRAIAAGNDVADANDTVAIRTKAVAHAQKITIRGFEEETKDGRSHSTGKHADYQCDLIDKWEPTLSVVRPWAYVLAHADGIEPVVSKLRQHGIRVDEIPGGANLIVTELTVAEITQASRPFQGHVLAMVDVNERPEASVAFGNRSYLVRTGQPLGSLACYLLEPSCQDGLCAWNYFDKWLKPGEVLPVYRLMKPLDGFPAAVPAK